MWKYFLICNFLSVDYSNSWKRRQQSPMSQRGQYLHLRARPSTAAWSRSSTMKTGSVEYGFWPTERAESGAVFHEGSAWFSLILLVWYMGKAVSSQGLRQPVHLLPERLGKSTSIAKQNKLIKVKADAMNLRPTHVKFRILKSRFLSSSSKWAYVLYLHLNVVRFCLDLVYTWCCN